MSFAINLQNNPKPQAYINKKNLTAAIHIFLLFHSRILKFYRSFLYGILMKCHEKTLESEQYF